MDQLLRTEDLERELGISRETIRGWRRRGIGPAWQRVGPRIIGYRRADVDAWLASEAERTHERAS